MTPEQTEYEKARDEAADNEWETSFGRREVDWDGYFLGYKDGADWSRDRFEKILAEKEKEIVDFEAALKSVIEISMGEVSRLKSQLESAHEMIEKLKAGITSAYACYYDENSELDCESLGIVLSKSLDELADWQKKNK